MIIFRWNELSKTVSSWSWRQRVQRAGSWDHPLLIDTNYRMRHSRTFFNEIFLFNGGLSDCAAVITRPKDPWMQLRKIQGGFFYRFHFKFSFCNSTLLRPQWLEIWVACKYFKEHFRDTIRSKKWQNVEFRD